MGLDQSAAFILKFKTDGSVEEQLIKIQDLFKEVTSVLEPFYYREVSEHQKQILKSVQNLKDIQALPESLNFITPYFFKKLKESSSASCPITVGTICDTPKITRQDNFCMITFDHRGFIQILKDILTTYLSNKVSDYCFVIQYIQYDDYNELYTNTLQHTDYKDELNTSDIQLLLQKTFNEEFDINSYLVDNLRDFFSLKANTNAKWR